jgi:hypothetical protein
VFCTWFQISRALYIAPEAAKPILDLKIGLNNVTAHELTVSVVVQSEGPTHLITKFAIGYHHAFKGN